MTTVEEEAKQAARAEPVRDDRGPDRRPRPAKDPAPEEREPEAKNGSNETPRASTGHSAWAWIKAHPLIVAATAIVLATGIVAGVIWWLAERHYETTDDAFVDARDFSIAPKVAGYLVDVPVTDNQHMAAGGVLARIDERDYRIALEQAQAQIGSARAGIAGIDAQIAAQQTQISRAEAQVGQARAAMTLAQQNADRTNRLVQTGTTPLATQQSTTSQLQQAQANLTAAQDAVDSARQQIGVLRAQRTSAVASLAVAEAGRDKAALDLSYTTIAAAQPGRVAHLSAARGQYAEPGQSLMMLVPDTIWITANFKETQITDMRPNQPVDVEIDAYPDIAFHGRIDSIQAGSGTAFSLLPAENATGNFVKVVQRVPVKIVLGKVPDDVVLGPGMSVVPKVRVR